MEFLLSVVSHPNCDITRATDLSGHGDNPLTRKKSPIPPTTWIAISRLLTGNLAVAPVILLSHLKKILSDPTLNTNCKYDNPINKSTYRMPAYPVTKGLKGISRIGRKDVQEKE